MWILALKMCTSTIKKEQQILESMGIYIFLSLKTKKQIQETWSVTFENDDLDHLEERREGATHVVSQPGHSLWGMQIPCNFWGFKKAEWITDKPQSVSAFGM